MKPRTDYYSRPAMPPVREESSGLLAECDRMDGMLGAWLANAAAQFLDFPAARVSTAHVGRLPTGLWRILILIWATSPTARVEFSDHSREGLISATASMDDDTLLPLVAGLLSDATGRPRLPAA